MHLGLLVMFSVNGKLRYPFDQAHRIFKELGLDPSRLPRKLHQKDAFRTATSNTRVAFTADDGTQHTLYWRAPQSQRGAHPDLIHRDLMHEWTQPAARGRGEEVRTLRVGEMEYIAPTRGRASQRVPRMPRATVFRGDQGPGLTAQERPYGQQLIKDTEKRYLELLEMLDGDAVRKTLREYLTEILNALPVAGGRGYFVHGEDRFKTIEGLRHFAHEVGGVQMMAVPMPDTPQQRENLAEVADLHIAERAEKLQQQLASKLETRLGERTRRQLGYDLAADINQLELLAQFYADLTGCALQHSAENLNKLLQLRARVSVAVS